MQMLSSLLLSSLPVLLHLRLEEAQPKHPLKLQLSLKKEERNRRKLKTLKMQRQLHNLKNLECTKIYLTILLIPQI